MYIVEYYYNENANGKELFVFVLVQNVCGVGIIHYETWNVLLGCGDYTEGFLSRECIARSQYARPLFGKQANLYTE